MKRHLLFRITTMCSLALLLTACTSLNYIEDGSETVKSSNVQTDESFTFQLVEKTLGDTDVKIGVAGTVLDNALALYVGINNKSDVVYKFDIRDIKVTSPVGDVTFILPSNYIEAYQEYESSNYAGLSNVSSTALGQFAALQNQYGRNSSNASSSNQRIEMMNLNPELMQLENNIRGIQKHTITSYDYIDPHREKYFYIFLVKPDEFPIEVKYKDLIYKFGGKKNAVKEN